MHQPNTGCNTVFSELHPFFEKFIILLLTNTPWGYIMTSSKEIEVRQWKIVAKEKNIAPTMKKSFS